MNEKTMRLMNQSKRDLTTCKERLEQAAHLYKAGKEAETSKILRDIAMLSSKITVRLREMLVDCGIPAEIEKIQEYITEVYPMEIGFTPEGWFGIRMEPLAKTKSTASKEYIRGIIYPAMRRFFADKATVRYTQCTMIFRHVYDRNIPNAQFRDYDNVEVKMVTDTIAMYVMVYDSPLHCRTFHCCAPGKESRTEVYVVPQNDFKKWCEMEDSIPDEGMPLSPCVPDAWKVDI